MPDTTTVCVVGLGYIGLPTAATLAGAGHRVVGVDTNPRVVETINGGQVHIVEPDLSDLVRDTVASGHLSAQLEPVPAETYLICVPTPFAGGQSIPTPDISHVLAAARSIVKVVAPGDLVIIESTCPVGTTERVRDEFAAAGIGAVDPSCLLPRARPARPNPPRTRLQRSDHWRNRCAVRGRRRGVLSNLRHRVASYHQQPHGRDGEARGEQLPGRQHRICQ